jgi:hypothetical protein
MYDCHFNLYVLCTQVTKWHETQSVCPTFHLQNLTNKSNDILSWAVHTGILPTSVILIYIRAYNIACEHETNIILLVIITYYLYYYLHNIL